MDNRDNFNLDDLFIPGAGFEMNEVPEPVNEKPEPVTVNEDHGREFLENGFIAFDDNEEQKPDIEYSDSVAKESHSNINEWNPNGSNDWSNPPSADTGKGLAFVVFGIIGILMIIVLLLISMLIKDIVGDKSFDFNFADRPFDEIVEQVLDKLDSSDEDADSDVFSFDSETDLADKEESYDGEEWKRPFYEIDWDNVRKEFSERTNYEPDEVGDEYYNEIVECIDDSLPYTLQMTENSRFDQEHRVCLQSNFYQISGDVPNVDFLNERLAYASMYYVEDYLDNIDYFNNYIEEYESGYILSIDSYATYTSDEILSIVLKEDFLYPDGTKQIQLYPININMQTGSFINNTEILDVDEAFAADFKRRSSLQNGENRVAVDERTNVDIVNYLISDDSLIIFYTPLGLEVGYNFYLEEGIGWITVTYKDYEQFLNTM